jgi:hypothetical protein
MRAATLVADQFVASLEEDRQTLAHWSGTDSKSVRSNKTTECLHIKTRGARDGNIKTAARSDLVPGNVLNTIITIIGVTIANATRSRHAVVMTGGSSSEREAKKFALG